MEALGKRNADRIPRDPTKLSPHTSPLPLSLTGHLLIALLSLCGGGNGMGPGHGWNGLTKGSGGSEDLYSCPPSIPNSSCNCGQIPGPL